jgi:hypothetical protein
MSSKDDDETMTKGEALALLGGSAIHAAIKIGVTQQAVSSWPDVLTPKLRDRVQAAMWRDHLRRSRERAAYRQAVKREASALLGTTADPQAISAAATELADLGDVGAPVGDVGNVAAAPNSPNTPEQPTT